MQKRFWISAAVGAAMPLLVWVPAQVFPTRLWYVLMPFGWITSHWYVPQHSLFVQHPALQVLLPAVTLVGDAALYGAVGNVLSWWGKRGGCADVRTSQT